MKPKRFYFRNTPLFGMPLRYGTPVFAGFVVLASGLNSEGRDILRNGHGGGSSSAATTSTAALSERISTIALSRSCRSSPQRTTVASPACERSGLG